MNAISTPIPGPLPSAEPTVFEPAPTRRSPRIIWGSVVVGLLVVATLGMWFRPAEATPADVDPLVANLDWFFAAALTHPGAADDGFQDAPFSSVTVQSVTIADPLRGPIVVVADAVSSSGERTTVSYEITVMRDGTNWSVNAGHMQRVGGGLAATPPES